MFGFNLKPVTLSIIRGENFSPGYPETRSITSKITITKNIETAINVVFFIFHISVEITFLENPGVIYSLSIT